jgi:hypothetical protein
MARLSIRMDLQWRTEGNSDMSKAWIGKIIQDREAQRELTKRNQEMLRRGEASAPMRFRSLKDQVEKDVVDFKRDSVNTQALSFHFTPSSHFMVRYNEFPVITLEVTLKDAVIEYHRREKKSASAENSIVEEGEIFIMAGSIVDAAYFKIKGKEFREEAEVSEFLLSPIFRALP